MVNMLRKKVMSDMKENLGAFTAIMCICALGIALFAGINLYVSTIEKDIASYSEASKLADYWAYKTEFSEEDTRRIQALPEIRHAQRRKLLEAGISGEFHGTLRLHAFEGMPQINIPELVEGSNLDGTETDAILLDSRFAEAHEIKPGYKITFGGREWLVKGIIRNAEYIYYAPDGMTLPDYERYCFAYTNATALPEVPYNELVVTLKPDITRTKEDIASGIRSALGGANLISRQHQPSCRYLENSLSGIKQIALLFPVAFFLTAVLVTWISVGRIMENQRQQLGTLRSLGFSKGKITAHYSFYGILITLPGMAAGWLVARFILAEVLYGISMQYYTIESGGVDAFSPHFFIASLAFAVITCGTVLFTCRRALASTPSALMRPKPPAKGHRILPERITPYWKRLSFSGKIVTRNLFRNKIRFIMGLVGIIGSLSLVLSGFGLVSSTDAMMNKAFNDVMQYDLEIKLKAPLSRDQAADILEALKDAETIDATMAFSIYLYGNSSTQNPYLVVMEEEQTGLHFTDPEGKPIRLPKEGALITPRMAKIMGVREGDMITAESLDGTVIPLTVGGIVDFPVGNEIYISRTAFEKISNLPFAIRALLVRGQGMDLTPLRDDPRIALIETKPEMQENTLAVLERLRSVQVFLISFSGLLAFAVMMVLGRMNFHERVRELATLKVLGFRPKEMKRLVLRENLWITLIGMPVGVLAAYGMLSGVLATAVKADMEIAPFLSGISIAAACLLLLGFTMFVNLILGRGFRKIDMISSLKSVE